MTVSFAEIIAPLQAGYFAALAVFLRVGAAMALLPGFGEHSVPVRVRLVLAIAFSAVVLPAVMTRIAMPDGIAAVAAYLGAETVTGLAAGAFLRFFVFALQMAGIMIAQATSLAQVFAAAGAEPLPVAGHLLVLGGLALAAMSGLHVRLAEMLIVTYTIFPAGVFPLPWAFAETAQSEAGRAFALAFGLAAPLTLAALLYNVALGVINRAMPQLMVSFIGAPALTLGSMVLMLLTVPVALGIWHEAFVRFLDAPFGPIP